MKVFISWSGHLSKSVAEKLRTWLRQIVQVLDPFVSSRDIQKGDVWLIELLKQLDESSVGIICVSRESLHSDWLLFESGALAKHVGRAKVCTLLIDISPVELTSPLSQFQATTLKMDDVFSLIRTIHSTLDKPLLTDQELQVQFDAHWKELESHIRSAIANPIRKKNEMQELADELLLPVIYREAREGELDTVFHWLQVAQKRNLIDLESTLSFVEASLARITGKRGAGNNLRVLGQKQAAFQGQAYVEMLMLRFSAQESLSELGLDDSFVESLPEQSMLTASTILGLWNLREGRVDDAKNYLDIVLTRRVTGGPYDCYRAIPLGILCFALGQSDAGEQCFDLAKNAILSTHEGYPFISLVSEFDRGFVNACIGIKDRHKLSDVKIREFRGHAWVLIQLCEILRRNDAAIDNLVLISTSWKTPLQRSAIVSRLVQFQKNLIANSGTPLQS